MLDNTEECAFPRATPLYISIEPYAGLNYGKITMNMKFLHHIQFDDQPIKRIFCMANSVIVQTSRSCIGTAYHHNRISQTDIDAMSNLLCRTQMAVDYILTHAHQHLSIAIACINASISHTDIHHNASATASLDSSDHIVQLCHQKRVLMIGNLGFSERLAAQCQALWIYDNNPQNISSHMISSAQLPSISKQADICLITGSALSNNSLKDLLPHISHCYTAMIGPSTILSPVLFDYGIDSLHGIYIDNPKLFLADIATDKRIIHCKGVKRVVITKKGNP